MTYTILCDGPYLYVRRPPNRSECNLFIRNGYTPPDTVSERNPDVFEYMRGRTKPNYPVPAIRQRDWAEIGYLSALNQFDTDDAFAFIKRYF